MISSQQAMQNVLLLIKQQYQHLILLKIQYKMILMLMKYHMDYLEILLMVSYKHPFYDLVVQL